MQKPKMYQSQLKKCSMVMPEKLGSWLLLKLESITIRILLLAIWMWLCLNSLDLFLGVREVVAASDVQRQKQLKFMCYV